MTIYRPTDVTEVSDEDSGTFLDFDGAPISTYDQVGTFTTTEMPTSLTLYITQESSGGAPAFSLGVAKDDHSDYQLLTQTSPEYGALETWEAFWSVEDIPLSPDFDGYEGDYVWFLDWSAEAVGGSGTLMYEWWADLLFEETEPEPEPIDWTDKGIRFDDFAVWALDAEPGTDEPPVDPPPLPDILIWPSSLLYPSILLFPIGATPAEPLWPGSGLYPGPDLYPFSPITIVEPVWPGEELLPGPLLFPSPG